MLLFSLHKYIYMAVYYAEVMSYHLFLHLILYTHHNMFCLLPNIFLMNKVSLINAYWNDLFQVEVTKIYINNNNNIMMILKWWINEWAKKRKSRMLVRKITSDNIWIILKEIKSLIPHTNIIILNYLVSAFDPFFQLNKHNNNSHCENYDDVVVVYITETEIKLQT